MKEEIEKIRSLVGSAKHTEAFSACKAIVRQLNEKDLLNQFYLLESRFSNYQRQSSSGHNPYPTEINDIIRVLLNLLSEIESLDNSDFVLLEQFKPFFSGIAQKIKEAIIKKWGKDGEIEYQLFRFGHIKQLFISENHEVWFNLHSINFDLHPNLNLIKFELDLVPYPDIEISDDAAIETFAPMMYKLAEFLYLNVVDLIEFETVLGIHLLKKLGNKVSFGEMYSLKDDCGLSINGVRLEFYLQVVIP